MGLLEIPALVPGALQTSTADVVAAAIALSEMYAAQHRPPCSAGFVQTQERNMIAEARALFDSGANVDWETACKDVDRAGAATTTLAFYLFRLARFKK